MFFMGVNVINLKLSRDSLDMAMNETVAELSAERLAHATCRDERTRLWLLIDAINHSRPLHRSYVSFGQMVPNPTMSGGWVVTSSTHPVVPDHSPASMVTTVA